MRTQKFKMHFTRAHLKDGEVYSVEHRRQYEVAREENARSAVKPELAAVAPAMSTMPTMMSTAMTPMEEIPRVETAAHEGIQAAEAREQAPVQIQQPLLPSHLEAGVVSAPRSDDDTAYTSAPPNTIQITTLAPMSAQSVLSSEQTSGSKRPASAMETSGDAVDPTSVLLMQFIALMDQRFQELVGKMGEMIDVQKDLIDTLQASNPNGQAPASAFSHAVEVVMKRRKDDTNPRGDSNSGSGNDNGNGDAGADADGGGQSNGFVI
ncbi:hypothetical protein PHYPSEUDO_011143 [Phytophthora pseudosyringae]|uniref:Uncharacterized protein n=1 Tax=Phytophthora pseudosyringae TaxID=221518 RepID=A0A8T1VBM4_9STRA|nr:hypothetical protein PHYPSEUDO_011143 [Phytophthora pseudosyringae]